MSVFSQRHYEAIAKVLKDTKAEAATYGDHAEWQAPAEQAFHEVGVALATMFAIDNPKFDVDRFTRASSSDEVNALIDKLEQALADRRNPPT